MRRNRSALVLSFLAGLGLLIGFSVTPSSAAPAAYPPTPSRSLAANTTTPAPGGQMTLTGGGWAPGVKITITIKADNLVGSSAAVPPSPPVLDLGSTLTNADGRWTANLTIPSYLRGHYTLTALGPNGAFMTLNIFVAGHSSGTSTPGSGNTGGGLPYTGVDVFALGGLSALLMLSGGILIFINRRRRPLVA